MKKFVLILLIATMAWGYITPVEISAKAEFGKKELVRQERLRAELSIGFSGPLRLESNQLSIWITDEMGRHCWRQQLFGDGEVNFTKGYSGGWKTTVELCTEFLPAGRYHLELPSYCRGKIDGEFEVREAYVPKGRFVLDINSRRGGFRQGSEWVAPVVYCHSPVRDEAQDLGAFAETCRRVRDAGHCHLHCITGSPQLEQLLPYVEELLAVDSSARIFLQLEDATPEEVKVFLKGFVQKPYFARVLGVWFTETKEDFSLFPQQFRSFLRKKYLTEQALSSAWREKNLLFSEVELPGEYDGELFDPERGGWRWIDFNYARHEMHKEKLAELCQAVKSVASDLMTGGDAYWQEDACQLLIGEPGNPRSYYRKRLPLVRLEHENKKSNAKEILRTVTECGGRCHWNLETLPWLAWEQMLFQESRFFSPLEGFLASVAHVTDLESRWHARFSVHQRKTMKGIGFPVDEIFISDLGHPQLPKYKLYFIDDIVALNVDGRRKLDSLKRDGNVLVFQHSVGYSDWKSLSAENISSLTGIQLREDGVSSLSWKFSEASHALLVGTIAGGIVEEQEDRRFIVEDENAVPLGTYLSDGAVAAAVKRHANWTSVYLPGDVPQEMLDNLAAYAWVHRFTDSSVLVRSDGRLLFVEGGRRTTEGELTFTEACALYDLQTGELVKPTKKLPYRLAPGECKLWFVGSWAEVRAISRKLSPCGQLTGDAE